MPIADLKLLLNNVTDKDTSFPKMVEITKVVRDGTNTMVIPLITPGKLKGSIIFRKVWIPFVLGLLQHL